MEVQALIKILQEMAPGFQADDAYGGFCSEPTRDVTRIGVCVDPTEQNIYSAAGKGMELLITYHPWWNEAKETVLNKKITLLTLHNAWDNATEGINVTFGKAIGLEELTLVEGVITGTADLAFREILDRCQRILDLNVLPYYGEIKHPVHKVGIWAGPGFLPHNKLIWETCLAQGCDTIISGEMSLLPIRFAAEHQLKLVDPGHSAIAKPGLSHLTSLLKLRLKALDCTVEFFDDYYGCSFDTKNYFLQQNDAEESLPLFLFSGRMD
jgi:putative NIF3 family GTP cyclohydrolase 1 type 2